MIMSHGKNYPLAILGLSLLSRAAYGTGLAVCTT